MKRRAAAALALPAQARRRWDLQSREFCLTNAGLPALHACPITARDLPEAHFTNLPRQLCPVTDATLSLVSLPAA